jgi:uncharacterized protein involved in exopolysaccharide biosynthesis
MEGKDHLDTELDDQLSDYLGALWRRRALVLIGTLLAGLAGLAYAWLTPPRYEAETVLLIEAMDKAAADAALTTLDGLLRQRDIRSSVPEASESSAVVVPDNVQSVSVGPGPKADLVSVRLSLDEPAGAARTLNAIVARALARYETLESDSSELLKRSLHRRLEAATARMDDLERPVIELRQKVDAVRTRRNQVAGSATGEIYRLEQNLARQEAVLNEARARYARLTIELQDAIEQPRSVRFAVMDPATVPPRPAPRRTGFAVMVAGLAGFLLSAVAAFVMDYFSDRGFRVRRP